MPSLRLTRKSVADILVPEGKAEVLAFDTELPGFGVKASAGGARSYIVQYRPVGQRSTKRLTIGRVDTLSLDEARRQARLTLAKAQTGADPQAEKVEARRLAVLTVGAVADEYLKDLEGRNRASSVYQTRLHLTKHWAPLRAMPLHKVRRADIAERLSELAVSSGGVSANRSRAALSAMFTWAIGAGKAELNPVTGTNKPGEEESRDRVLTAAEVRAIWHACRNDDHGRIVRLLLLTATRRTEVGGMVWADLDLPNAMWTMPKTRTKNGVEHDVPLSDLALETLAGCKAAAGRSRVFGDAESGFSNWSASKARLDKRIKDAGIVVAPWGLHDLRRTASTMMAEHVGIPPHVISSITNHAKEGMQKIYNRATYRAMKRDGLDRWAAFVTEMVMDGAAG